MAGFAAGRLGVDPVPGLSVPDWLILTGHSVLEVTAGPVFADQTMELAPVRAALRWYPPDVERYVLTAGWQRELAGPLTAAVTAPRWPDRENGLAGACEVLLSAQRARGLPAPAPAVTPFWDRPYRTVSQAIQQALLAEVTDPRVRGLPAGIGSIEQWADNVDVLSHPARRRGLRAAYQAWTAADAGCPGGQ